MAKIFPNDLPLDSNPTENSIRKYFEQLPHDWLIFHGSKVTTVIDSKQEEYEMDFFVINPEAGFVIFEVKGGRLVCKNNQWYQSGQQGVIRDPVVQAKRARSLTRSHLVKLNFSWAKCINWCCLFPDTESRENSFSGSLTPDNLVDSNSLDKLEEKINRLLELVPKKPEKRISSQDLDILTNWLSSNFVPIPSLKRELGKDDKTLIRLTDEQSKLLSAVRYQKKVYVVGSAGTGKTILAEKFAQLRIEEGLRTMYLCYNEPLVESMSNKSQQGLEVFNFHKLCKYFCDKANIPWNPPSRSSTQKKKDDFYNKTSLSLLQEASLKIEEERWDVIIIDEAQDFKEEWLIVIEELLKDRKESFMYAFIDPFQDIFNRTQTLEEVFKLRPLKLDKNCRNTKEIALFSYGCIDKEPIMHEHSPTGNKVQLIKYKDGKDQISIINKILSELILEKEVLKEEIVILSTKSKMRSSVWKNRNLINKKFSITDKLSSQGELVYFDTVRRFKGLDSKVIVITDVDYYESDEFHYTGFSRAKLLLYVLTNTNS